MTSACGLSSWPNYKCGVPRVVQSYILHVCVYSAHFCGYSVTPAQGLTSPCPQALPKLHAENLGDDLTKKFMTLHSVYHPVASSNVLRQLIVQCTEALQLH